MALEKFDELEENGALKNTGSKRDPIKIREGEVKLLGVNVILGSVSKPEDESDSPRLTPSLHVQEPGGETFVVTQGSTRLRVRPRTESGSETGLTNTLDSKSPPIELGFGEQIHFLDPDKCIYLRFPRPNPEE